MPTENAMPLFRLEGAKMERHEQGDTAPMTADQEAIVARVLQRHAGTAGPLLPILHEVQDALGHVPPGAVPAIAHALNLSRAEVHGVISFYPRFRTQAPARLQIEVCQAEACQAMGARGLARYMSERLGCGMGRSTPDNAASLHPVFCLGLCAQSPAIMINGQPYARVTPERLDTLLSHLEGVE